MKAIHVVLICILTGCSNAGQAIEEKGNNSASIPFEEADTAPQYISQSAKDTLTTEDKKQIFLLLMPGKKSLGNFEKTEITEMPDLYKRMHILLKRYSDSAMEKRMYISELYTQLDNRYSQLGTETEVPVEFKLKIAEIQSSIHTELAAIKKSALQIPAE